MSTCHETNHKYSSGVILLESDKGSYFDQEQWLKELNEPSAECDLSVSSSTCSPSRSKITVQ